jgi:hypothetical protein
MVSKTLQDYIARMPSSAQTALGREMLELKAHGTPEELVDMAIKKRLGLIQDYDTDNADIKNALGEILTEVKEVKKLKQDVADVKKAIKDIPASQQIMMPFNTDLPPISGADFGIKVNDNVSIGSTQGMTSKIVMKEETKKDDTSSITEMLRKVKESNK